MTTLTVEDLTVEYGYGAKALTAVDGVSLSLEDRRTLGIVGESGSGKSTLARSILGLVRPSRGRVLIDGQDASHSSRASRRLLRDTVQLVFQDPHASLNPRLTVGDMLTEAVGLHDGEGASHPRLEVGRLLELVSLAPEAASRYPHQFSGGQLQRVAIARALATKPRIVILDEVTSALDVSVQAVIINLLRRLQSELGLGLVCISHDLSVVRHLSDEVAVMYLARIVEQASTDELFARPRHPYTRTLIDSVPRMEPGDLAARFVAPGDVPDPRNPPHGCRFHPRCPVGPRMDAARVQCVELDPSLEPMDSGGFAACHFPLPALNSAAAFALTPRDVVVDQSLSTQRPDEEAGRNAL